MRAKKIFGMEYSGFDAYCEGRVFCVGLEMTKAHSKKVLNLIPVRKGGGLQNALSFVTASKLEGVVVLTRNIPELVQAALSSGAEIELVPDSTIGRLLSELRLSLKYSPGSRVLTLFGPILIGPKRYIDVVGCAYSNLFYPEVDFWKGQSRVGRVMSWLKDGYRKWAIARGDAWIFETGALRQRSVRLFSFPDEATHVVRMTAGWWAAAAAKNAMVATRESSEIFRVAYVTGYHVNKRVESLLGVASRLKALGDRRFKFVVTIDPCGGPGAKLLEAARELGVVDYFELIGRVPVNKVPDLIQQCHAMCNFAVLESFTNNVVEAWACLRPIVITDADWSRDACNDAAVYVNPLDVEQVVVAFRNLADNPEVCFSLSRKGVEALDAYPSIEERTAEYWKLLEGAVSRSRDVCVWERSV